MLTITSDAVIDILNQMKAVGGPFNGKKLVLFSDGPAFGAGRDLTEYTECVFDGYARVALTFGTPFSELGGDMKMDSNLATFICTGTTTPESAVAWGIITDNVSPTPDDLIGGDFFDQPVPFSAINDGLALVISIAQSEVMQGSGIVN